MYEYTSAVFAVGLDGFAQVDHDTIAAMSAEGWEPTQMTAVHHGFAAIVLFRREGGRPRRASRSNATASRTRAVPAKATTTRAGAPAKRSRARSPGTRRTPRSTGN